MFKQKRPVIFAVLGVVLLISLFIVFGGEGQANQQGAPMSQTQSGSTGKQRDDDATPIVDLNSSTPVNGERALKNAQYDNRSFVSAAGESTSPWRRKL